ncbi:hypothetical protein LCGC14_1107320 [marine sediment metagenome]|uniref:Glycosyltransferase 2-like domain-containing protein n=1 Tax=marine sediment metagenome TaxID=412755 RepID=A0A0F9QDZ9_9ZZZZ
MIYACYITYNNGDFLAASLYAIAPYVDKIIIIEGPFPDYPEMKADNTKFILWHFDIDYPNKLMLDNVEGLTQVQKRNAYIDLVPDGSWMFIIDGDEIPYGNLEILQGRIKHYDEMGINWVSIKIEEKKDFRFYPRLIKKQPGMKYKGFHWSINEIYEKHEAELGNIKLIHFRDFRHKDVVKDKKWFYNESPESKAEDKEVVLWFNEQVKALNPERFNQLYDISKSVQKIDKRPKKANLKWDKKLGLNR